MCMSQYHKISCCRYLRLGVSNFNASSSSSTTNSPPSAQNRSPNCIFGGAGEGVNVVESPM